ncbi:MAG: hypothetical protein K6E70_08355 [Butyrivibrio sp.]|nr:hypothetical protein [Butyrivibrio sp.]
MKKVNLREDRKGFTIAELLIVIAIIIILMAFGFIAGMRLIRNMRQSHLDKRAEAVYYAAESRMMELFVTEEKTEKTEDKKVKAVVEKLYNAKTFNYEGATLAYITSEDVGEAKNLFAEDNSLEAEIKSASWIIEYDPVSLNVFAVIFSDDLEKAGTSIAELSESPSGAPVRGAPQDRIAAFDAYVGYYSEGANGVLGASAKNGLSVGAWILNRRDLLGVIKITADENTRAAIENLSFRISLKGTKSTSDGDEVDISSNEIYWQNYAGDSGSNFLESDGRTGIVITTNDVRNTIPVSCFGDTTDSNDKYGLIGYIKLDSLDIDRQFKDLKVKGGGALGDYITPGDDITMSVKVWDSSDGNSNYSQNVRRTSAISNTENSLYADFDVEGANGVAKIVYPRHLQNLAAEFSEVKAEMAAGNSNPGSMDAVLLEDITWDEEKNLYKQGGSSGVIRNFTPISNTQLVSFNGYRFETAKSAQPLRNIEDVTKENPEEVNLKSSKKENKYHYITGLRIDTSDSSYRIVGNPADIGLFGKQSNLTLANLVLTNFDIKNNNAGGTGMLAGELDNSKIKNVLIYEKKDANKVITGAGDTAGVVGVLNSSSIEDCVIKNISVKTTAGSAGALVGKATSAKVENTLAYNGEITGVEGSNTPGTTVGFDDSKLEITGARNAGGLIGEMEGGSVTGAAAALYVRATGGNAGGFVGNARGASIDMCHSGGHTVTLDNKIGRYDKVQSDGSKGRVNVIGSGNAGGFAGKLDGASVQNSYSTCSATAGTVGGFVGASSGGTISKSYAVGQVFFTNAASAGGFAGSLGGAGVSDDHYFEIINPTEDGKYLQGVGNVKKDVEGLKAIDKPLEKGEDEYEYNKFMLAAADLTMARQDKTHRYDSELQPAIFAMPFCSQLKDATASDMFFVEAHYGDWPIVETLVINADSSARVRFTMSDPFAVIKAFASDLSKSDILRSLAEEVITTPIPEEDLAENKDTSEEQAPAEEEEKAEETKEEETQPEEQVEETTPEESETPQEETRQDEVLEENTEAPSEEPATEEAKDETATDVAEPQEEKPADETAAEAPTEDKEKEDQDLIEEHSYAMVVGEEEEEPEDDSIEGRLEAEGSGVAITFGKDAEIPEGSELQVTYITEDSEDYDYSQLISDATEAMEIDSEEVASYKAIDIAIMKDGEEIQPKASVDVEIKAENFYENKELFLDDEVTAVHIKEDDPEVIGTELKKDETEKNSQAEDENPAANESADFVNFTADGFSVYVLVQPISAKKVITSDDSTYQITVDYDNASGIPADAELVVAEIQSDSDEYADCVENGAKALDTYSENVVLARVFDISFVDPMTGDTYQPSKDVKVSVELLQDDIENTENEISVVHFGDDTQVMDSSVNGSVIEFDASGFSKYAMLELELDLFDASLANKKYYISYFDGAHNYLDTTGASQTSKDAATLWEFTTYGDGYKIHSGSNYLKRTGNTWSFNASEADATVMTASDMGDYHWLCEAKCTETSKYLGYASNSYTTARAYGFAGNNLMLTYGGDEDDTSINGSSYYIRDNGGNNYVTISGSTIGSTTDGSAATKWEFVYVPEGYKIRSGESYIKLNGTSWVITTSLEEATVFTASNMGAYHYLHDENDNYLGYGSDGYTTARSYSEAGTQLIVSETSGGADIIDTSLDGVSYYVSKGGNYLKKNGSAAESTVDGSAAPKWTFVHAGGGAYYIHNGNDGYLKNNSGTLQLVTQADASTFIVSDMGKYHLIWDGSRYLSFDGTTFDFSGTAETDANAKIILSVDAVDNIDISLDGNEFYVISYLGWYLSDYSSGNKKFRVSVPKFNKAITRWTFTAADGGYKIHNGSYYFKVNTDGTLAKAVDASDAAVFIASDMGEYHVLQVKGDGRYLSYGENNGFYASDKDFATSMEPRMLILQDINISGEFVIYTKRSSSASEKYYRALVAKKYNDTTLVAQNISDQPYKTTTSEATSFELPEGGNSDLMKWTFEKAGQEPLLHYVSCMVEGKKQYLKILNNVATITDTPVGVYLSPCLGDMFKNDINRRYRIVAPTGDTSHGLKTNMDNYSTSGSIEDILTWHYLATIADDSNKPIAHTVHYIYSQDPDDKGTPQNLPVPETVIVSGNAVALKKPSCDYYVSKGNNYAHTYLFKGWRCKETGVFYSKEQIEAGVTVDITNYPTVNFEAEWELDVDAVVVRYIINDVEPTYGSLIDADENGLSYLPMSAIDGNSKAIPNGEELIRGTTTLSYGVREIRNVTESDSKLYHLYQRLKGHNYHTYEFKYWKAENGSILKPGDVINLADYKNKENEVVLTAEFVNTFQNGTPAYVNFSIIRVADTPDNTYTDSDELVGISESLDDYAVNVGGTIMNGLDDSGNIIYPDEFKSPTNPKVKYWMIAPYSDRDQSSEKEVLRTDNAVRYKLYGDGYTDDGYTENKFHQRITGLPTDVKGPNNYGPVTSDYRNTEIRKWSIPYIPSDEKALKILRDNNAQLRYRNTDTSTIPVEELTPENYTLRWYFVKYQSGDGLGFHIDGKLTRKTKYIAITKTFKEDKTINAVEGLFDKAKKSYEGTSDIAAIGRKLIKEENGCFYIELEDTENENHVIKLVLYDRTKKDDDGNDIATSYYSMLGTGTDTYGYLRKKNWEDDKYRYFKFTWLVALDEYNAENKYVIREKNYNFEDETERYGVKIEYNKTNTSHSGDEEIKEWNTETLDIKADGIPEDTSLNIEEGASDECVKTNLYNTYYRGAMLRIKKVDGNSKNEDGSEKVLKDVVFKVYEGDNTEPSKVHKISDGKYSLYKEASDIEGTLEPATNEDGLLEICLKPSENANEPKVYTIRETIPADRTGHGDEVNNAFILRVDTEGKITLNKQDIKLKKSYGSVIPCDDPAKNEGKWVKIDFDTNNNVQTGFYKVVNGGIEDIAFNKIDGDGKLLAGAQYQLYEAFDTNGNDNFDKVMNGDNLEITGIYTLDSTDAKEFVESTAAGVKVERDDGKETTTNVNFKVPAGIYYMKEIVVPSEYEPDYYIDPEMPEGEDPDKKDGSGKYLYHKPFIYKLTVGNDEVKKITTPDMSTSEKTFMIQRCYKEGGEIKYDQILDVEKRGIINISTIKRKVLLKKVDGSNMPLTGKKFEILRSDGTAVIKYLEDLTSMQDGAGAPGTMSESTSGAAGAFYIDRLPIGTYYLHELSPDKWFKLEVKKDEEAVVTSTTKPDIFNE